jgi:hypothetical protein
MFNRDLVGLAVVGSGKHCPPRHGHSEPPKPKELMEIRLSPSVGHEVHASGSFIREHSVSTLGFSHSKFVLGSMMPPRVAQAEKMPVKQVLNLTSTYVVRGLNDCPKASTSRPVAAAWGVGERLSGCEVWESDQRAQGRRASDVEEGAMEARVSSRGMGARDVGDVSMMAQSKPALLR